MEVTWGTLKRVDFWPSTRLLETEFPGGRPGIFNLNKVPIGDFYGQVSLGNPGLGNNQREINTEGGLKLDNLVCKICLLAIWLSQDKAYLSLACDPRQGCCPN